MSDIPTVQQRAAEVLERAFLDTRQGKMRNDWVTGEEVAAALAAAGLLADPTTSRESERAFLAALDPKRPDMIEHAAAVTGRPSIVERLRTHSMPFERAEDYRTMALIVDAATEIERLLADQATGLFPESAYCHGCGGTLRLAYPTTSRTDVEQAVIDAAKAWRWGSVGPHPTDVALRAAVDRLAAPGPKEADQSRYGCDLCGTGFGHHSTSCRLAAPGPEEATP